MILNHPDVFFSLSISIRLASYILMFNNDSWKMYKYTIIIYHGFRENIIH